MPVGPGPGSFFADMGQLSPNMPSISGALSSPAGGMPQLDPQMLAMIRAQIMGQMGQGQQGAQSGMGPLGQPQLRMNPPTMPVQGGPQMQPQVGGQMLPSPGSLPGVAGGIGGMAMPAQQKLMQLLQSLSQGVGPGALGLPQGPPLPQTPNPLAGLGQAPGVPQTLPGAGQTGLQGFLSKIFGQ